MGLSIYTLIHTIAILIIRHNIRTLQAQLLIPRTKLLYEVLVYTFSNEGQHLT